MLHARETLVLVATALLAAAASSCSDPVHDARVKLLGGERDGIPEGEYHRAGQPCVDCHGELGPATMRFSVAGTVFNGPTQPVGEDQVEVEMVDANGMKPTRKVLTNCVGNFFVTPDVWNPAYPILVWVRKGDQLTKMTSHVGRDGSCGSCHTDPATFDSPGHVYLYPKDQGGNGASCPAPTLALTQRAP